MLKRVHGCERSTIVNANAPDPHFEAIIQQIQNLSVRLYQHLTTQEEGAPAVVPLAPTEPTPPTPMPPPAPTIPQVALSAPPSENRLLRDLVEQFVKLKPLKFLGTGNPNKAEKWIDQMKVIFDMVDCNEADKVSLGDYQLLQEIGGG